MKRLLKILAPFIGMNNPNAITTRIPDETKIVAKEQQDYTYIPLTVKGERDDTTYVFVKPGVILTIKKGGHFNKDGKFRSEDGPITHYLVQGIFANSSNQDSYMALCIPRDVIEERFQINH